MVSFDESGNCNKRKTIALPFSPQPKAALVLVEANKIDHHFTLFWAQHL
jgi:hypothetical protein